MSITAEPRPKGRLRIATQPDTWVENGRRYFRTLAGLAECFEGPNGTLSTRALRDWGEKGCPMEKGRYDLPAILAWRDAQAKRKADPIEGDPLLSDGADSPALEEYRRAKAALARLDLAEREKQLVRVDEMVEPLMEAAAVVRAAGERIGREYGPEAQEVVNEAVAEFVAGLRRASGGEE